VRAQKRGLITKKISPPAGERASTERTQVLALRQQAQQVQPLPQAKAAAALVPYFDAASQQPLAVQARWQPQSAAAMANLGVMPTQQPTTPAGLAHVKTEMKPSPRPGAGAQRPGGRSLAASRPAAQGPDLIGHLQRQCAPSQPGCRDPRCY
jgi:hypothetical protein